MEIERFNCELMAAKRAIMLAILLILILFQRAICQRQISDGYPTTLTSYRAFRTINQSYMRFKNKLNQRSDYLTSYTFEMYIKLVPQTDGNGNGQTSYNATIYDCFPHSQVNISDQSIVFWQDNGNELIYSFAQNEFQSTFLGGQWVHLSFGYNNYSTSQNMQMLMRFYVDGLLKATSRVYSAAIVSSTNIGDGLCYFGNSRALINGLNADTGFFLVSDVARFQNFQNEVFHKYPQPYVTPMIFYFKLDDENAFNQDFYFDNAVQDYLLINTTFNQDLNVTGICECYTQPQNIIQFQPPQTRSNPILISNQHNLTLGFSLDFWVLIYDNLEGQGVSNNLIFSAENLVKVELRNRQLLISSGATGYMNSVGSLYLRKWIYFGIQVAQRVTTIYQNGVQVASFSTMGPLRQNNTLFYVYHQLSLKLQRLRLMNSVSTQFSAQFFYYVYQDGSNNAYEAYTSVDSSIVVFDFVLSAVNSTDLSNQGNDLFNGGFSYISEYSNYTWNFVNAMLSNDYQQCGADPLYVNGVCEDNQWFQTFNQSSSMVFNGRLETIAPIITIEFWFKCNSLGNMNQTIIQMVDQTTVQTERFRAEVSPSRTSTQFSIGSLDSNSTLFQFKGVQSNQWYHIAWISNSSDQTNIQSQALLFDYQLFLTLYRTFAQQNPLSFQNQYFTIPDFSQNATSTQTNTSGFNAFGPQYTTFYLGNSFSLDSQFFGIIRDLRVWFEARSLQDIALYRNIEIPVSQRSSMPYYFRNVGETSFVQVANQGSVINADLSLVNALDYQSPIRFQRSTGMIICPYLSYLSDDCSQCILPSVITTNPISFIQMSGTKQAILNTQAVFSSQDFSKFNISTNLVSLYLANSTYFTSVAPLFASGSLTQLSIPLSSLSNQYKYTVEFTFKNKYFKSVNDVTNYIVFDPLCPSYTIDKLNPYDNTLYIYNRVNYTYDIQFQKVTYCLSNSFINQSSFRYSWELTNQSASDIISFSLQNSYASVKQISAIQDGFVFNFNITLSYQNFFYTELQVYSQVLRVQLTKQAVEIIFSDINLAVQGNMNMILNMSQSFIISPDFINRGYIQYNVICPQRLFTNYQDYKAICQADQRYSVFPIYLQDYSKMNLLSNITYYFTVNASVVGLQDGYTLRNASVTWVFITPTSLQCPEVIFPPYVNISILVNYTQIFPAYRINCQRGLFQVNYYNITSINWAMNTSNVSYFQSSEWLNQIQAQWKSFNKSNNTNDINKFQQQQEMQQILDFQDGERWAFLTNSSRFFLKPGEVINVTINYTFQNSTSTLQISRNLTLITIATQFVFNLASDLLIFNAYDNISLDLSKSYDPQDPGTPLSFSWQCPLLYDGSVPSFCPKSAQPYLNISVERRVLANWTYNKNLTFNITAVNPHNNKKQNFVFSILINPPNKLITDLNSCPMLNFTETNAVFWIDSMNNTRLKFTNNITNFNISFPQVNINCSNQSFTIDSLQLYEETPTLLTYESNLTTPSFLNQNSIVTLQKQKIKAINQSQDYIIQAILWTKNQTGSLNYTMIDLIVSREDTENLLISNFTSSFYNPMENETVVINASNSFDNFNIYNRNFSYNWTCPPQAKLYCPTNSTFNLTADLRKNISMNKPGLIYRFNVSIYDQIRVSNTVQTELFIRPNSSTGQCLSIFNLDRNITTTINQFFELPLIQRVNRTHFCDNITIQDLTYEAIGYSNPLETLQIQSWVGPSQSLMILPYIEFQSNQIFQMKYIANYSIVNDYQGSAVFQENITIDEFSQYPQYDDYALISPQIVNLLQNQNGIQVQLESFTNNSSPVQWICDSTLQLEQICQYFTQLSLLIDFNDFNFGFYQENIVNNIFKIQAVINSHIYTQYILFTNLKLGQYPQNCQIKSSQPGYVDVSKLLLVSLVCDQSSWEILSSNGASYSWTIANSTKMTDFIINATDITPHLKLKPYAFAFNARYTVNLTISYADQKTHYSLLYDLNTSRPFTPYVLVPGEVNISNEAGYFYQSAFNFSFTGWGTNSSAQQDLNLFSSLRYYDGKFWFEMFPLMVSTPNITNMTLPSIYRLIGVTRNNYNEIVQIEFQNLSVFNNKSIDYQTVMNDKLMNLQFFYDINYVLNEIVQINQLLQVYNYDQSEQIIDQILNMLMIITNNMTQDNKTYCFLPQICHRYSQTIISQLWQITDRQNLNKTQISMLKTIILNSIMSNDVLIYDLNQNLPSILYTLLPLINDGSADVQTIYAMISQYSLQQIAPGETMIENGVYITPISSDQDFQLAIAQTSKLLIDFQSLAISIPLIVIQSIIGQFKTTNLYLKASFTQAETSDSNVTYFINQIPDINIMDKFGNLLSIGNLSNFINITFSVMNVSSDLNHSLCVFSNNISTNYWLQDDSMATAINSKSRSVSCLTRHLTQFAVVSEVFRYPYELNSAVLQSYYSQNKDKYIIAMVIVSILFVFSTFFTLILHNYHMKNPDKVSEGGQVTMSTHDIRVEYQLEKIKSVIYFSGLNSTLTIMFMRIKKWPIAMNLQIFYSNLLLMALTIILYLVISQKESSNALQFQIFIAEIITVIAFWIPLSMIKHKLLSQFSYKFSTNTDQKQSENSLKLPNIIKRQSSDSHLSRHLNSEQSLKHQESYKGDDHQLNKTQEIRSQKLLTRTKMITKVKMHESENLSPKDFNDEYKLPEIFDQNQSYTNRREHIQQLRTLGQTYKDLFRSQLVRPQTLGIVADTPKGSDLLDEEDVVLEFDDSGPSIHSEPVKKEANNSQQRSPLKKEEIKEKKASDSNRSESTNEIKPSIQGLKMTVTQAFKAYIVIHFAVNSALLALIFYFGSLLTSENLLNLVIGQGYLACLTLLVNCILGICLLKNVNFEFGDIRIRNNIVTKVLGFFIEKSITEEYLKIMKKRCIRQKVQMLQDILEHSLDPSYQIYDTKSPIQQPMS